MDEVELERLGLNRNEAKVYLGLLQLRTAAAAELVRRVGVHRNIVYDNIERLIDKGLVTFVEDGGRRIFIAEDPHAIIEYLEDEKTQIDGKINAARSILPRISALVKGAEQGRHVKMFRGKLGLRMLLAESLEHKECWCIGISQESVRVLGETYWANYNAKVRDRGIVERFLINHDYADVSFFDENPHVRWRRLPPELSQNTEILLFGRKVAMFVYEDQPIAVVLSDAALFRLFLSQFNYLWLQAEGDDVP